MEISTSIILLIWLLLVIFPIYLKIKRLEGSNEFLRSYLDVRAEEMQSLIESLKRSHKDYRELERLYYGMIKEKGEQNGQRNGEANATE